MAKAQFPVWAGVAQAHNMGSDALRPLYWQPQQSAYFSQKWKNDESISKCATFNLDKNFSSSFNEKGLCSSKNVKNTTLPGMLYCQLSARQHHFSPWKPTQIPLLPSTFVTVNFPLPCFLQSCGLYADAYPSAFLQLCKDSALFLSDLLSPKALGDGYHDPSSTSNM